MCINRLLWICKKKNHCFMTEHRLHRGLSIYKISRGRIRMPEKEIVRVSLQEIALVNIFQQDINQFSESEQITIAYFMHLSYALDSALELYREEY